MPAVADTEGTDVQTVAELARNVPRVRVVRGGDVTARKVRVDSRAVEPGDLFVAIAGERQDGARFVADALARGAAGVVTVEEAPAPEAGAWIVATDPREAAAHLAAAAWNHPSKRLDAVGFTGTNGKTTSTFLLAAIARAAGRTPAVIGTLGAHLPGGLRPLSRTTPEAPELQAALADAVSEGADLAAIEVSSHALDLRRVDGTSFAAAAFLNLTAEHLDWHGTMERYGASKLRLFSELLADGPTAAGRPRAVLHRQDPWADRFRDVVKDAITFATGEDRAGVTARGLRTQPGGTAFDLVTPDGAAPVALSLPGRHNVDNALAAAAVAWVLGIESDVIARGLSSAQAPPGRFERVHAGTFDAYVDYAHTEDGLTRALEAARSVARGRLLVVLGCGGNRDTAKRPGMGRIAAAAADQAIFTSDNPRDEDPEAIIEAMLSQVEDRKRVEVVIDREAALERAVALAEPGDVLLAAGKGHEDTQEIRGEFFPFPEREILSRLSEKRDGVSR